MFEVKDIFNIVLGCDRYPYAQLYKILYISCFFRISNIVPVSKNGFDVKKISVRGGVIVNKNMSL